RRAVRLPGGAHDLRRPLGPPVGQGPADQRPGLHRPQPGPASAQRGVPIMSGLINPFRGPRLQRRWKADVDDHVIALAWSASGKELAAASVSGPVTLFDAGGAAQRTLSGHRFGTTSLSWKPDGVLLATAGQDGKVRLWEPQWGVEVEALPGGAAWVEHVSWHSSAEVLASAAGKKLKLWSAKGKLVREYPDHPATISDLAWRPRTEELT